MDKPAGPTSHDVVARVRRVLGTRSVGHTGTLDPFATGLLVVLAGRATRLARFVEQQPKRYLASARLGVVTTTDDLMGEVVAESAVRPSPGEVEETLARFLGVQMQRPPAFSAKKVGGERSYAKARRGELLELAEVEIEVHAVELLSYEYPEVRFRAVVSPGSYLRGIARDLGERLGTGAHLTALRREAIGPLQVERAVPLEALTGPTQLLRPLAVVSHLPRVDVGEAEVKLLGFGQAVRTGPAAGSAPEQPVVAVAAGERLVAVGRIREEWFHPEVVLEAAG